MLYKISLIAYYLQMMILFTENKQRYIQGMNIMQKDTRERKALKTACDLNPATKNESYLLYLPFK